MAEPLDTPLTEKKKTINASDEGAEVAPAPDNAPEVEQMNEPIPKPPSKLKVWWGKLGITPPILILMFKGALPPTIGLAMYESDAVAKEYATVGYLIAIISILALAILPRAKFLQNLLLAIVGTCVGAALTLLGIYTAVKAREHSTPANATELQKLGYNSSANAVCGVWLTFNIWFANTLRASRPALQVPVILYTIFISVGLTTGPREVTMALGQLFVRRLLITFLTGFGIAAGVSWFIVPISCRKVVFGEMGGYIALLQGALKVETAYMSSLTGESVLGLDSDENGAASRKHWHKKTKDTTGSSPHLKESPEAAKVKAVIKSLGELHGKLHGDLPYAKRELAYGNFTGKDLDELWHHLRAILLPVLGMSTLADIFDRLYERRGKGGPGASAEEQAKAEFHPISDSELKRALEAWNLMLGAMRRPFEHLSETMVEALDHCAITLQLKKVPKKKKGDEESTGDKVKPGTKEFSSHFETKTRDVYREMIAALKVCVTAEKASIRDIETLDSDNGPGVAAETRQKRKREQYQLFLVLYMEHLFFMGAASILGLVKYADSKVKDGTLTRKRFIHPDYFHLKKWLRSIFREEDGTVDLNTPDSAEGNVHQVQFGDPIQRKYDPEHLPPRNWWQKLGNLIRHIPRFLGSPESAFGFRVAAATMCVGILAYLHNTQTFFFKQRAVWAMVIITIGMTPTSGSATFGFIGRVLGTLLAMINSYINWYIVDGHRAGVIVFLFVFIFLELFFVLRFPRFIQITILAVVTQVLIIGYELQVKKLGEKLATSNGQPYYPIYTLAPYRLGTTAAGCVIAYFWTIFPNPITDRSQIRKDLGKALYLLANFYSYVHTTVETWMLNSEGDQNDLNSPGRKLEKFRYKVFGKEMLLLMSLRQHSEFTKWEPTLGGSFPKKVYDNIIEETQNILQYMALIAYATHSLRSPSIVTKDRTSETINIEEGVPLDPLSSNDVSETTKHPSHSHWLEDLSRLTKSVDLTSHSITSLLSLLSASVLNGQALPPYLQAPNPYELVEKLEAVDKDILHIRHIEEPGYSAFAVMEIASSMISDDLSKLLENVKTLVGEVDFAYQSPSTKEKNQSASSSTLWQQSSNSSDGKGKRD